MNLILVIIGGCLLAERLWKYALIREFFRQSDPQPSDTPQHLLVSILQPILSGDPTLWDCLSRNLEMTSGYPLEFLWLIDQDDEVAQAGCEHLIAQYPEKTVHLIPLPPPAQRISPKTFKLIEGVKQAQGQIIAVLDDDTILPDYGLEDCIPVLDQAQIGLAFGLPYYINFSNLWSSLVSCFVNGNSLLTYIPYSRVMPPITINGMFYVMKREVLAEVGGFLGLENSLCDDYAIAQRFRDHGYQLAQTSLRHGISTQVDKGADYFNLINRWFIFPQVSLMRSANLRELSIFYSLVLLPNFFPLFVVLAAFLFPGRDSLGFALLYLGLNAGMMIDFNHHYLNDATPLAKISWILAVQILLPFQIFLSLFSPRKINWRGHIMEVNPDGGFTLIQRRTS